MLDLRIFPFLIIIFLMLSGTTGADNLTPDHPLKVVAKNLKSAPTSEEHSVDVQLMVKNTSDQIVTAYKVSCYVAESDGNGSSSGIEIDAFFELENGPEASELEGIIRPGEVREFVFPRPEHLQVEPYVAMSCGVETAIFEDGTFWGLSSTAKRTFKDRKRYAGDTAEIIEQLQLLIRDGEIAAGKRLSPTNAYAEAIRRAELRAEDSAYLHEMLKAFKKQAAFIQSHLPASSVKFSREDLPCPGCGDVTPLIISLGDETYDLTSAEDGVSFDLNGDEKPERTAWTAADSDEGFLALDRNFNGRIDNYMEVFGNHTPQFPSDEPNGWRALAMWDDSLNGGNEDGVIDAHDEIFSQLLLWVDSNHNGFSEPEELSSLGDQAIVYLSLDYDPDTGHVDAFGNGFRYPSVVGKSDGSTTVAWDVFLATPVRASRR